MSKNSNGGDYEVGRGKPPRKHQFKKGQSGNPQGREAGSKNFRTDFMEELRTKIEITEGGKKVKISKQRALIKRLINGALSGDAKATTTAVGLLLDFSVSDDVKDNNKPLSEHEIALLKNHLGAERGEHAD